MTRILAQVSIPYASGVPSDVSVNTWAFDTGSNPLNTASVAIISALQAFYDEAAPIYSEVLGSTIDYKLYDIDEPEPRTPLVIAQGAWTDPGSNPLPEEVACCLSFRGTYASGQAPARRRGRIYIGPLGTDAAGEVNGRSAPAALVETSLAAALEAANDILAPLTIVHSVWSRADDAFYPVTAYWMDNAWDTQRRRGPAPTQRIDLTPT